MVFLPKTYISRLLEKLERILKKEKLSEFNSRNDRPIIIICFCFMYYVFVLCIIYYGLCFFTQKYPFFPPIWQPVILAVFYPKNIHFWTHIDLELPLGGAKKCPKHLFSLLGECFDPLCCFQIEFFL